VPAATASLPTACSSTARRIAASRLSFWGGRYPEAKDLDRVLRAVARDSRSVEEIAAAAEVGGRKTQVLLTHLSESGFVACHEGRYASSGALPSAGQLEALARSFAERRQEDRRRLEAVVRYAESTMCRVRLLTSYFGESPPTPCRRCDRCRRGPAKARSLVCHPHFGEGEVLERRGSLWTVFFPQTGQKTVQKEYLEPIAPTPTE
jgi:ATP-dependent DNA helicase RecQ